MRRITYICLLSCSVLAGCEKPPLVVYPGDPAQSAGTVPNSAPIVTAGDDVTLQWPTDFVQLTGSATDDGVRSPLKYTWTAQPAGVQFDSSISAQTTARFAQPGTYTLTLMVDDGALQTSDSLVVTVKEVASNLAPVVSAGADVTIDFPRPAKLDGTATDDGVPTTTLTATWSRLNGPGDVTFVNASSIDTAAKFSALGTYELQLSVTDGELTATDVVIVTVGPAVYPAADLSEDDPNRGWSRIAPADVGLDPAPLAEAQAYALTAGGSGVISRYGRIVHSWGDIDQRFDVKSTTKSIAGTALAFALEDGLVRINDLAATHVPEIQTQPSD
ncbi:MAG TPA: PKD domain-containing protein, partial [Steroidobacteraceae bacterium]|nr:PKD domain-containing protein [Steroidobacteraceae bacterium]